MQAELNLIKVRKLIEDEVEFDEQVWQNGNKIGCCAPGTQDGSEFLANFEGLY